MAAMVAAVIKAAATSSPRWKGAPQGSTTLTSTPEVATPQRLPARSASRPCSASGLMSSAVAQATPLVTGRTVASSPASTNRRAPTHARAPALPRRRIASPLGLWNARTPQIPRLIVVYEFYLGSDPTNYFSVAAGIGRRAHQDSHRRPSRAHGSCPWVPSTTSSNLEPVRCLVPIPDARPAPAT
jgi:hypothetical protein